MRRLTYTRTEWSRLLRQLDHADRAYVPPGLAERIDALLRETPQEWPEEPCTLELDAATAAVVQHLSKRGPMETGTLRGAEGVIRDDQQDHRGSAYRIEHRCAGDAATIAYVPDVRTMRSELARHTARLLGVGATGEVVLIEQARRTTIARRSLWPEPVGEADTAR